MFDPLYTNEIGLRLYLVAAVCLVCAVTDVKNGKIYNSVTYPAIVFGIAYNALSADAGIIASSVGGCLLGLLPFGLAAARGLIGGGDVKLFAAVGAISGFFFLLDGLFNCFIITGIYIGILFIRRKIRKLDSGAGSAAPGPGGSSGDGSDRIAFRKRPVRLGVFIFLGVLLSIARILLAGEYVP